MQLHMRTILNIGIALGTLAMISSVAGCTAAATTSKPSKVAFVVTGVEWKGATSTDSLAAPSVSPKTLSAGYQFKGPGEFDAANPKRWEVSTYVWAPGAMTVLEGDTVTLRTFIVNGDKHNTWVQAPDGAKAVEARDLERGREYSLTFTASQVGAYQLVCATHAPTMTANITVLPRA